MQDLVPDDPYLQAADTAQRADMAQSADGSLPA